MLLYFLNMMLFAMHYSYKGFYVYFLNVFMLKCLLNKVKAETDEIKK